MTSTYTSKFKAPALYDFSRLHHQRVEGVHRCNLLNKKLPVFPSSHMVRWTAGLPTVLKKTTPSSINITSTLQRQISSSRKTGTCPRQRGSWLFHDNIFYLTAGGDREWSKSCLLLLLFILALNLDFAMRVCTVFAKLPTAIRTSKTPHTITCTSQRKLARNEPHPCRMVDVIGN